jgi:type 1 fimbriae regulatory protein FimB/type 1 fimbriae regulatory protein FimE
MTAQVLAFNRVPEPAPKPERRKDRKAMPSRPTNAELRTREYLTSDEIEALMTAARRTGRHGHRDATLILIGFRHGMRVSELVALQWSQVDLRQGLLHVRRAKNGTPATHPLRGPEIRALRRLIRDYPETPYVFVTERRAPLTPSTVRHIVKRAGEKAGLGFPIHPHMLRHSCGFYLANIGADTRAIQCYLGHRNISNTVIYTQLAPQRFNRFWRD